MRVYHLLPAKWGLASLSKRHLKISQLSDLNDPFELLGANLSNKNLRRPFGNWKQHLDTKYGLMCFSEGWQSPLLWSHYGDRHRGIALGFDIPDNKAIPVRYVDERIAVAGSALDEAMVTRFLSTKFDGWSYEKEIRVFANLTKPDLADGKFYADFSDDLQLRAVVVGALSNVTKNCLMKLFKESALDSSKVAFAKARLAFKSYSVVPDKRGLR